MEAAHISAITEPWDLYVAVTMVTNLMRTSGPVQVNRCFKNRCDLYILMYYATVRPGLLKQLAQRMESIHKLNFLNSV